jgi:hypothetical protein
LHAALLQLLPAHLLQRQLSHGQSVDRYNAHLKARKCRSSKTWRKQSWLQNIRQLEPLD